MINIINVGTDQQGCVKGLCDLLSCPDPKVVSTRLKGLENILRVWSGEAEKQMEVNVFGQRVDECEGRDKIEKLLTHWNDEISERAARILKEMTNDGDDGS